MTYTVELTLEAEQDHRRLFDFILERELARAGGELDLAVRTLDAIQAGLKLLEMFPFTCRKAGDSAFLRELVISFGGAGYVALFEIVDEGKVVVGAARHQREDDCH
jgi:plasmid stabilization system protein ParE